MSCQLLGKKEAIYSLPQKLAVTACADRRLRSKCTGDSSLGRRFRPGSGLLPVWHQRRTTLWQNAGKQLEAGDSGSCGPETPADRRLRTISGVPPDPYPEPHHKKVTWQRKTMDQRFRVLWPETPVGPETPDHLRTRSKQ